MAYIKKTLADLKQSLADRHDSGVLPTSSSILSFWTRLLNRGLAYCSDRLRLIKSASLTISGGTVAFPDDFITIERVVDSDDNILFQIPQEQSNSANNSDKVFWIKGDFSSGFTLNIPVDATYIVYYSFRPAELINDSDICIIPDPEAVVSFAYALLRQSETDPLGDVSSSYSESETRLNKLKDDARENEQQLGFSLQPGSYSSSNNIDWPWNIIV